MTNRITITLDEYLKQGYTLPSSLSGFKVLTIGNSNYSIEDEFIERFRYREIGSETQELFKHNLSILCSRLRAKYNPQIDLLNENFSKLMSRVVTETESKTKTIDTGKSSNVTYGRKVNSSNSVNAQDDNLLNPISVENGTGGTTGGSGDGARVVDINKRDTESSYNETNSGSDQRIDTNSGTITDVSTKERAFGFFKSNPEILAKAMMIASNLFNDILDELDRAFIGEY